MRLLSKILMTLLFVAVLPVSVSGLGSITIAQAAIEETANEKLVSEARHLVEVAETTIFDALDDLAQSSALNLHRLNNEELVAALGIIYRDDARRNAIALIDGRTGKPVVDVVFQEKIENQPGLAGHEPFTVEALDAFASHIPLNEALRAGRAISLPYADPARGLPLIALAVRVRGPLGRQGEVPWVIACELSLRALNARFESARDEGVTAFLVDLEGKSTLHSDRKMALARTDLSSHPGVVALTDPMVSGAGTLPPDAVPGQLAAYARAERLVGPTGQSWGVIVERPRNAALARVAGMRQRTLFWTLTALLLALAAGFVLSRGIARPIELLTASVSRFGQGETDVRSSLTTSGEIGALAAAFNNMADAIAERDRELRGFNEELQERVNERTRELKEAQDQLIHSQKAAAVGELGAGVAHEINNPLAGVLGTAQLALLRTDQDSPVYAQLKDIEREALRIQEIVESLMQLSHDHSGEVSTVDVNEVVESALALCARPIIAQRIQVRRALADKLPKIKGSASDLQQAIMQLLNNAKEAMPDGGVLSIRTENVDDKLSKIIIEDTGQGIPEQNLERIAEPFFTTRSAAGHKGMGLSIVHRITEENGGRLTIESRLGKGSTVRLVFPATREQLHLA